MIDLWVSFTLKNNKQHVCYKTQASSAAQSTQYCCCCTSVLEICGQSTRNPQEMISELQVEINSPPHLLLCTYLLDSQFPPPLSVFYSHLMFQAPLFSLTLSFPCFTQLGASSGFRKALLVLAYSALYQHSSLHSLFCRTILKTILFSLLWICTLFFFLFVCCILMVYQVRR